VGQFVTTIRFRLLHFALKATAKVPVEMAFVMAHGGALRLACAHGLPGDNGGGLVGGGTVGWAPTRNDSEIDSDPLSANGRAAEHHFVGATQS